MSKQNGLKIEKGVPLPERGYHTGSVADLIRQMEIGDSIVFPKGKQAGNAFMAARFTGAKVTTRKQPDGTTRVWRVA